MKNKKIKCLILGLIIIGLIVIVYFFLKKNDTIDLDNKIDALSYNMKLDLDTKNKVLNEKVEMEIKNNTRKSIDEIVIRDMTKSLLKYYKENYNKESNNKSEILGIKENDIDLKYTIEKDSIVKVKLNKTLKPNDTVKINVSIKTDIPERQDRFGYIKRNDGYIYALSFCFPYLADNIDGKWILNPYFDDGENRSYDLADYEIEIKHPSDYLVIATGSEETNNGITKITAKNIRDIAIVLSDMYKKDSFEVEGIKINNYYLDSKYTEKYRKLTKLVIEESIKVYTDKVGKYPYDTLDIAPLLFGFGYGGMEYPSLIMTNATSFYDGTMMDAWSLHDGLTHEIGHQWFYGTVGNNEYSEGWIDEGFTTYLERQLFGLYDGEAHKYLREIDEYAPSIEDNIKSREELMETAREDYKDIYLNVSPDKYENDQSYGEAEYETSYIFIQEIRMAMGDEKFNKFLKDFYKTYYLKTVNTDMVLKLIREYDNSKKINEIIDFYFK
ncbi:MAG: M1 family metallopeptidase [Bacilli bacterium]|nr:M1 family metallopeptidase [Bacilli bacterium]